MFGSIFRPYGTLWTILNNITDTVALSLLWCLCCLPVVTIGPATTALYDSMVRGVRYGQEGVYRRFFRTFRRELTVGIPATLLWGVILLFGFWVLALLEEMGVEDTTAGLMAGAYHVVLTVPMAAACWSAMIASRFTCKFGQLTVQSVQYLPVHLLQSVLVGCITWAVLWYCTNYPIGLTFAPALCVLGWSLAAEPVFAKYGAGLEKKQKD